MSEMDINRKVAVQIIAAALTQVYVSLLNQGKSHDDAMVETLQAFAKVETQIKLEKDSDGKFWVA